jgi:hypothetical protein
MNTTMNKQPLPDIKNYNLLKNILYQEDYYLTKIIFSHETFKQIRDTCVFHLRGVHPEGKKIIPSDNVINQTVNIVYENYTPSVGDARFGMFLIDREPQESVVKDIILQSCNLIIKQITDEYDFQENAKNFSIWNTNKGEFNQYGLMPTPEIKLNERYPNEMFFAIQY